MNRVNNVRLGAVRPRQVGAVFTENLLAFIAKQPLERWIHVLPTKQTKIIYQLRKQLFNCQ